MYNALLKFYNFHLLENLSTNISVFVRYGHHLRGKSPGIAKSLTEKLSEKNFKDPSLYYKVDIGLPPPQISKGKQLQDRLKYLRLQRDDSQLEKLSRTQQLRIDLEETNKEWLKTVGPSHIRQVADHYGVFEHLFGDAYFNPYIPLEVSFEKSNVQHPVYFGNALKPEDASQKPSVSFDSEENSFWTLILTNPDGHFTHTEKEYLHWFVANIPGNQIEKGETIIDYIQPFPPKGTGYHRYIFILYKQEKKLDFSTYKKQGKCLNLEERTFKTYDFYRSLQDDITPAGLLFFQADWSPTLKEFFHSVLDMKEPVYEYDFPPPYIKRQKWFPKRQPFNLYMDKYRDPKQINKEFLCRKLTNVHPFKAPAPPLPYPNAQYIDQNVPSWLKTEIRKTRLKEGRINEIE